MVNCEEDCDDCWGRIVRADPVEVWVNISTPGYDIRAFDNVIPEDIFKERARVDITFFRNVVTLESEKNCNSGSTLKACDCPDIYESVTPLEQVSIISQISTGKFKKGDTLNQYFEYPIYWDQSGMPKDSLGTVLSPASTQFYFNNYPSDSIQFRIDFLFENGLLLSDSISLHVIVR